MIELVTGIPSSGKSYFASSKMLEIYKSKGRLIYTNINLHVEYDDYIHALDVPDLYTFASSELQLFEKFTKLSNAYKKKLEDDIYSLEDESNSIDDEFSKYYGNYDKYLKDSGILENYGGSYIFWDECHNDLDASNNMNKADPVWIRFFSYHRHFDIDIMLITQDISLVHRKYRPFIAKYYFGQNPAKRLTTKTLRFKVYTDHREFEKFYIETIQVPMKKEVFDFYDSGEYNPNKSLLLKKLLPAILLLIAIFTVFFLFFNRSSVVDSKSNEIKKYDNNDTNCSSDSVVNNTHNIDDDNDIESLDTSNRIVFFMCNLNLCTLNNTSFTVPLDGMDAFAESTDSILLYTTPINTYYKLLSVSVNESLYNDLMKFSFQKRGDKHENNKINFNSPVSHL